MEQRCSVQFKLLSCRDTTASISAPTWDSRAVLSEQHQAEPPSKWRVVIGCCQRSGSGLELGSEKTVKSGRGDWKGGRVRGITGEIYITVHYRRDLQ